MLTGAEQPERGRIIFVATLIGISAAAFALRIWHAADLSLGLDEVIAVAFAHDMRQCLADVHPPVFYALLSVWIRIFSDGPLAIRVLSAILGAGAVVFTGLLARRLYGNTAGLAAAALLAGFPFHVVLSRQDGLYAMVSTLAVASLWLTDRIASGEEDGVGMVLLAAVNVLGVFTAYVYVVALLLQGFFLVFSRRAEALRRREMTVGLGAPLAALVLASPFVYSQLRTLWSQLGAFPALARLLDAPFADWLESFGLGAPWLHFAGGETFGLADGLGPALSLAGFIVLAAGAFAGIGNKSRGAMAVSGALFGTVAVLLLASIGVPLWRASTLSFFTPLAAILMAQGLARLRTAGIAFAFLLAAGGASGVAFNAAAAVRPETTWQEPPDWRELASTLAQRYSPGDDLLVTPGWMAQALRYHLEHGATAPAAGLPLPIIDVPFNFFSQAGELDLGTQGPGSVRVWVVSGDGFGRQKVQDYLEGRGYRPTQRAMFWRLGLDLFAKLESPPAAPASEPDAVDAEPQDASPAATAP